MSAEVERVLAEVLAGHRSLIADLDQRCADAENRLRDMQAVSERLGDKTNAVRLSGKREGVALARDYLRDLDGSQ